MTYTSTIALLIISLLLLITTMYITLRVSKKTQVQKMMLATNILLISWCIVAILEETWRNTYGTINMIYINLTYISICFVPIFVFLFGLFFVKTKMKFSPKYLLLFVVPIITTVVIWTNNSHHYFFDNYSVYSSEATYGWYYFFHSIYSYGLIFVGLYLLLSYSIRNAGLFSRQSILMIFGISAPVVVNIAYSFNLVPLTFNINPIAFTIWSFCTTIALQKFKLLNLVPIALQKVVDCMSDSYFVVNNELELIDYNKSFSDKFMKNASIQKSEFILEHMEKVVLKTEEYEVIKECTIDSIKNNKSNSFEQELKEITGIFNIDINPIISDDKVIGAIVLFKDITELKRSQNAMIEQERLASLGQLAGGMAHDINTPIATIRMGIDFFNGKYPYTEQEEKMLSAMKISAAKITEIVESVRNQIRNTGESQKTDFLLSKVIDNIKILVNNELEKNKCKLLVNMEEEINLYGDFGKLSQVIMNIVMNAIQAYNGEHGEVKVRAYTENDNAVISIIDNAGGIPQKIADGLFKEILTTKGTKGTGFGLYFAKSMVRAEFNGDITFETEEGKGTAFYIRIPIKKEEQ